MSFENIFSSYLYHQTLNLNLNSIKKHILKTYQDNNVGTQRSNYGGWRSPTFTTVNDTLTPLFQELNKIIKKIKKKITYQQELGLINYWYNVNSLGSSNNPHTHIGSNSLVSGVFYVSTFKDSGNIVFMNNDRTLPLLYDKNITTYNEYSSSTWFVVPKNNLAVFFPSNLLHYVQPNLNKNEKRISISFNYGF